MGAKAFTGDGKYVVQVVAASDREAGPSKFLVFTLRLVESDNDVHPREALREFRLRYRPDGLISHVDMPTAMMLMDVCREGIAVQLTTRAREPKTGQSVTRLFWTSLPATEGVFSSPLSRPEITYGATCRTCNEHNPQAEARADFVCYGCRH